MSVDSSSGGSGPRVVVTSRHGARHNRRQTDRPRRRSTFPVVFGLTLITTCIGFYDLLLVATGLK